MAGWVSVATPNDQMNRKDRKDVVNTQTKVLLFPGAECMVPSNVSIAATVFKLHGPLSYIVIHFWAHTIKKMVKSCL